MLNKLLNIICFPVKLTLDVACFILVIPFTYSYVKQFIGREITFDYMLAKVSDCVFNFFLLDIWNSIPKIIRAIVCSCVYYLIIF